jgi:hypothetical protein
VKLIHFETLFLQRDTSGLSSENTELKLRLQAMEQQAKLCDGTSYYAKMQTVISLFHLVLLVFVVVLHQCTTNA